MFSVTFPCAGPKQLFNFQTDKLIAKISTNTQLDKSWFAMNMPEWKRLRASGQSLDHHAYAPLKTRKPVDMAKLQEQIKVLYDEECDELIQLREFQMNGVVFEF